MESTTMDSVVADHMLLWQVTPAIIAGQLTGLPGDMNAEDPSERPSCYRIFTLVNNDKLIVGS